MTTPLSAMSLTELASEYYCGKLEGSPEVLIEFRRRDALAASNAERERLLVEAARAALTIHSVAGVHAALRSALAPFKEKTDG